MDQKPPLPTARALSMRLSSYHAPVFAVTSVTAANLPKPRSSVGFWTDSPCRLCFVGAASLLQAPFTVSSRQLQGRRGQGHVAAPVPSVRMDVLFPVFKSASMTLWTVPLGTHGDLRLCSDGLWRLPGLVVTYFLNLVFRLFFRMFWNSSILGYEI